MIRYQNIPGSGATEWQASATNDILRSRAHMFTATRNFFHERGYLEVDTPCLLHAVAPEQHIEPFQLDYAGRTFYLQTSPELAMKRLIAGGSGPIFQIAHVFRQEEWGKLHNPEFRLLEWYHPQWTYRELMHEVDSYVREILQNKVTLKATLFRTYQSVFSEFAEVDPFAASSEELAATVKNAAIDVSANKTTSRDEWLDLIFSMIIQPRLPKDTPVFIHDFPASQAALAEIKPDDPAVAQRFELLINGIELANGFQELTNAEEQLQRFLAVNAARESNQQAPLEIDLKFIAALQQGFPSCAGVAVGLDRLLMISLGLNNIQSGIPFPWQPE